MKIADERTLTLGLFNESLVQAHFHKEGILTWRGSVEIAGMAFQASNVVTMKNPEAVIAKEPKTFNITVVMASM